MTAIEVSLFLRSKLPVEVVNIIQLHIRENAANTIINYWRKNISELNIALVEFCKQTRYYPISQTDINLLFVLKKVVKNRTINIDCVFWKNLLLSIFCGMVKSRETVIENNHYNDVKFLQFYGKIMNDLIGAINIRTAEGRYRHFVDE